MYDVIIAGGSITGLLCAREIASQGNNVLVIEEDYEIGTPEHCGGMVSSSGLEHLGVIPNRKTLNHIIETAKIFSPCGKNFSINSVNQKVAEINRRELDKQIAHQAQKNGAEIRVKTSSCLERLLLEVLATLLQLLNLELFLEDILIL